MKLRDLLKKKSFWIALSGAVVIILQVCGIKVDSPIINEIMLGVCSLLVAGGVITASDNSAKNNVDSDVAEDEENATVDEEIPADINDVDEVVDTVNYSAVPKSKKND